MGEAYKYKRKSRTIVFRYFRIENGMEGRLRVEFLDGSLGGFQTV